jgi:hypothetical protein
MPTSAVWKHVPANRARSRCPAPESRTHRGPAQRTSCAARALIAHIMQFRIVALSVRRSGQSPATGGHAMRRGAGLPGSMRGGGASPCSWGEAVGMRPGAGVRPQDSWGEAVRDASVLAARGRSPVMPGARTSTTGCWGGSVNHIMATQSPVANSAEASPRPRASVRLGWARIRQCPP